MKMKKSALLKCWDEDYFSLTEYFMFENNEMN